MNKAEKVLIDILLSFGLQFSIFYNSFKRKKQTLYLHIYTNLSLFSLKTSMEEIQVALRHVLHDLKTKFRYVEQLQGVLKSDALKACVIFNIRLISIPCRNQ